MLSADEAHSLGVLGKYRPRSEGIFRHWSTRCWYVDEHASKRNVRLWRFYSRKGGFDTLPEIWITRICFSVECPPCYSDGLLQGSGNNVARTRACAQITENKQIFLSYARERGADTGAAQGYAIVPIIVGESMTAGFLSQALYRRGIYVMPVSFPAVKEGTARLRFFYFCLPYRGTGASKPLMQ